MKQKSWQTVYAALEAFVAEHPEIKIKPNMVMIPDEIRPQFYSMFDEVRKTFVREKFGSLIADVTLLGQKYFEVESELINALGLKNITIPTELRAFLTDPMTELTRSQFDLLFEMIKKRMEPDTFEKTSLSFINAALRRLFKAGYKNWVVLSLLSLLSPDELFSVPLGDVYTEPEAQIGLVLGLRREATPNPEETKSLTLEHVGEAVFVVPDFIAHSIKIGRYVSIGTEATEATWTAKQLSEKREWQVFREIMGQYTPLAHWPDLLVYVDDNPKDIAVVADFGRLSRPDLIVECMDEADWHRGGVLERVKFNHGFFKPRRGTYIVSRLPVSDEVKREIVAEPNAINKPEEEAQLNGAIAGSQKETGYSCDTTQASIETPLDTKEKQSNIYILEVNFDQKKMEPLVDALSSREKACQ